MVAGSRPGQARKVSVACLCHAYYDPITQSFVRFQAAEQVYQIDSKRGKQLFQEIDVFVKNRQKQNKILAKNVAEWVDKAMTINSQLKDGGQLGSNGEIEDLDIEDFDDDDYNEGYNTNLSGDTQKGTLLFLT